MKLSDYVAGQLAEWGVRHVFLVTGGGAMHLNDPPQRAARRSQRHYRPGRH